jgi:mono/diheme cytochrome c family protein
MHKAVFGLALVVFATAAASGVRAQETGDKANGQKLFMADGCYQCHGTTGHGGGGAGPTLTPPLMQAPGADPAPEQYQIGRLRFRRPFPLASAKR